MKTLLELFNENGHVAALSADRAKQFDSVCYKSATEFKESFQTNTRETRLDDFYITLIGKDKEFRDLINVIKMVLTFSHGNASVESGFSINKDMLVENLHETSLIALRTVYDGVKSNGGIENVKIIEELMNHSRIILKMNTSHKTLSVVSDLKRLYRLHHNTCIVDGQGSIPGTSKRCVASALVMC
ncbi:hypothetical protein JTE90_021658 [Oedothorax gibbosus]|uniref:Uncharacterized protein n=1 Tax=Oedothorax gibbosus TaxID=931172 RepID=A0AAV6VNL1_9ARAC|nr:hypothetical protein JTE90_021658 [Oedothorax gibbosus]